MEMWQYAAKICNEQTLRTAQEIGVGVVVLHSDIRAGMVDAYLEHLLRAQNHADFVMGDIC